LTVRRVPKAGSVTVTSAARGIYAKDERSRQEAMSLITYLARQVRGSGPMGGLRPLSLRPTRRCSL